MSLTLADVLLYLVAPFGLAVAGSAVYDWLKTSIPRLSERELEARLKEIQGVRIEEYRWRHLGRAGSRFIYVWLASLQFGLGVTFAIILSSLGETRWLWVPVSIALLALCLGYINFFVSHKSFRRIQYAEVYYHIKQQRWKETQEKLLS